MTPQKPAASVASANTIGSATKTPVKRRPNVKRRPETDGRAARQKGAASAFSSNFSGRQVFQGINQERGFVLASLLALTVLYFCLAAYLNGYHAFWSADSGARFAAIAEWRRGGSLTSLPYGNAAVDPAGRLHPLQFYVMHGPRGFTLMYPPLFLWLCGQAYAVFGFGGLTLFPLLFGVGTLWVTYAIAVRLGLRCRAALPLVLGLATPLPIYAVVFWDHTLIMFLAAAATYLLLTGLQSGRLWLAVLAGLTLGLGVWVHELFLALFAAALLERVEKVEISNAGLEFARLKSGMASKTPASIDTKKRR